MLNRKVYFVLLSESPYWLQALRKGVVKTFAQYCTCLIRRIILRQVFWMTRPILGKVKIFTFRFSLRFWRYPLRCLLCDM